MPPSGFNEKAIQGLMMFLEACYEDMLKKIDGGVEPKQAIREELADLRKYLSSFTIK